MLEFIKKNIFIILIFLITLFVGFITFLTFIDKSFIELNEVNLQYLLIVNIVLLLSFFVFVFLEIKKSIKNEIDVKGSKSNKKYITFFALFTLIPSILISIFSLFLFSFALEKYFDKKITTAVNNSYELAKNYVQDVRNKIESDIVMIAFDINKSGNFYQSDPRDFKKFLINQKILRNIDEIHIITDQKKIIMSTLNDMKKFIAPDQKAFDLVMKDDRPLKIINAFENKSAAILKLPNYKNTYIYVVKYLEQDISKYLTESQEALNFYYTVEDKRTGIQISFILIYLIVVSLMLFLSVSIAIRFSSRFFRSINNLVNASMSIGRGNLDTKVPEIKTDKELESLNKNFNLMIDRLKTQQDKLLLTERHEAWENVARKLAHEIKNPLTPIQLIIDRFDSKFSNLMSENDKSNFNENLKIINKQIKQIENLINEFSDFARMPKPILKKHDIVKIIKENILLMNEIDKSVNINFKSFKEPLNINCDSEQLNRIFTNLFKNSIESLKEKFSKRPDFTKKIDIEILKKDDYIQIIINDNGLGFSSKNLDDLLKPYFTTKSNGTGLGLPIVNKIINDHNGTLKLVENKIGATIKIDLPA